MSTANSSILAAGEVGSGKSYTARRVIADSESRALILTDSHALGYEHAEHLRALGVEVAKPIKLDEKSCHRHERVKRLLTGGHSKELECARCPYGPNGAEGPCRYRASWARCDEAQVLVATKACVRDPQGFERLAERREVLVIEEDALSVLAPTAVLFPESLPPFLRALRRIDVADSERACWRELLRLGVLLYRLIRRGSGTLIEIPTLGWDAQAILARRGRDLALVRRAWRNWAEETYASQGPLPRDLLATLEAVARRVVEGQVVFPFNEQGPAMSVRRSNRIPGKPALWLLDATPDLLALKRVLPEARRTCMTTVGGGEEDPPPSLILQVRDSTYSRRHFRLAGGSRRIPVSFDQGRLDSVAQMIAQAARLACATRIGLITFKALVEPLRQAVSERLPSAQVDCMYYHNLRGRNDLKGVEALFVVGTPTPNPAAVTERALLREPAADVFELGERPAPCTVHVDESAPWTCMTYASTVKRGAWYELVEAEVRQAIGRAVRGRDCARLVVFFGDATPRWYPERILQRTPRDAGLGGEPSLLLAQAAEMLGPALTRSQLAEALDLPARDSTLKRAWVAWRDVWSPVRAMSQAAPRPARKEGGVRPLKRISL